MRIKKTNIGKIPYKQACDLLRDFTSLSNEKCDASGEFAHPMAVLFYTGHGLVMVGHGHTVISTDQKKLQKITDYVYGSGVSKAKKKSGPKPK